VSEELRSLNSWIDWALVALIAIGVISMLPALHRLPMALQDIGFCMLLLAMLACPAIAWWRVLGVVKALGWRKWRVWMSIGGCVALTGAILIPMAGIVLFFLRWDWLTVWLAASVLALLLGVLAIPPVRFLLTLGGFGMVSLVLLIPKGVL
jgi:hypothetical protein